MKQAKKIGIMGGTFNPIHIAHLILGESAYDQFGLDSVYFMPSKNPPHKDIKEVISDSHRTNMVKLAIADNPHFEFSDVELLREGYTYTVDTITYLKETLKETEFYFIIGADSLFMLDQWYEADKLLKMMHFVAATRDHATEEALQSKIAYLANRYGAKIDLLHIPTLDVSSQYLRNCIKEHRSIRYYVPSEVEAYIRTHQLYLDEKE